MEQFFRVHRPPDLQRGTGVPDGERGVSSFLEECSSRLEELFPFKGDLKG
jgi:hypothetical protein